MALPSVVPSPKFNLVSPNACIWNRFTSNIPMPTLYSGDSVRKPKLSVIEVLMYNMAALLAGVAAGYDVRMSNVSPVHPTLQPQSVLNEIAPLKPVMDVEFTSVIDNDRRFAHNTYHGPARHSRAALTSMSLIPDDRNTRRSDSPQHYHHPSTISTTSGLGSNFTTNTSAMLSSSLGSHTQPPTPSPRRKISTSSFTENFDYSERDTPPPQRYFDTRAPPAVYGSSALNEGYATNQRPGYFGSNYFPYRPEINLAYERDCKSYPDYSYDSPMHHNRLPSYYDYTYEQQTRTPPPRVPQMGITAAGHRRTPSTVSASSNVNQAFSLEHDDLPELYDFSLMNIQPEPPREVYKGSPGINRMRDYENLPFFSMSPHHQPTTIPPRSPYSLNSTPHRDLSPLVMQERPASLSFEHGGTSTSVGGGAGNGGASSVNGASNKLRSSMKKYYRVQNTNGSASGTPTNPTPPDSLTSDDSSYMSAKEGSISSQHSRVRFSPDSFLDGTSPPRALPHEYTSTMAHGSASVNGISRRVSRRHTSDMAS